MDTFKVDTAVLNRAATSFQQTGNQMKSLTTEMTSLVNGISDNVWSSDASRAYKKKFKDLDDDIKKMLRMVDEHVKDLQEMIRVYETAEKNAENIANALASNVIQ